MRRCQISPLRTASLHCLFIDTEVLIVGYNSVILLHTLFRCSIRLAMSVAITLAVRVFEPLTRVITRTNN